MNAEIDGYSCENRPLKTVEVGMQATIRRFLNYVQSFLKTTPMNHGSVWQPQWSEFLNKQVAFYRQLTSENRVLFEKRVLLFLHSTRVEGGVAVTVTDEDKLLVAASAIIPVWSFPKWHYFNLKAVYLLPATFDGNFVCGTADARISGMVGTGPMAGKLALSKPHLHQGFSNVRDKQNVGVHEFVHLIDMADGECDGFPERLMNHEYALPWFELVKAKIEDIDDGKSNIRDYGATNAAEFLSVASEYFFERPKMLARKHPELTKVLSQVYQQDVADISIEAQTSRNAQCPCGSGRKYKRCCFKLV